MSEWGLTFEEYMAANKQAGVGTVEDEEEFRDIVFPGLQAQLRKVVEEGEKPCLIGFHDRLTLQHECRHCWQSLRKEAELL